MGRLSAARAVAAAAGDAAAEAATRPSTRSAMRSRARQRALKPALEGAVVAASRAVAEAAVLLPSLRREQQELRAAVAAIESFNQAFREGSKQKGGEALGTLLPSPLLLPPPPQPQVLTSLPLQPQPSPSPRRQVPELLLQLPLPSDSPSIAPGPPLWTPPGPSAETSLQVGKLSPPAEPLSPLPGGFDHGAAMDVDARTLGGPWGASDPASSGDFVEGDGSNLIHDPDLDGVGIYGDVGSGGDGSRGGGAGLEASPVEHDFLDDLLCDTPAVGGWPSRLGMPYLAGRGERGGCGNDTSTPQPLQPLLSGYVSGGGGISNSGGSGSGCDGEENDAAIAHLMWSVG
ncbi:hypothetical protein MMPV_006398 [Pyropia vietnamensis]